ncbi:MAG: 16S rRNA (guanine(527)-N(7))-methyltransferase RsmG [Patescibacteria group bacterium]
MQEFLTEAKALGIHISESQKAHFEKYLSMLLEWNQKFNLTGITERSDIWIKHFLDSLTVLEALPEGAKKIADIGSGAGFPGLPIAIIRSDLDITLLESTGKKVNFLLEVIRELGLKNVRAAQKRAEEAGREKLYRGKYDAVLARAVAMLPVLWDYAFPLLKSGGVLIAQKKSGGASEIDGKFAPISIPINISILPERELIVIKKA